MIADGVGTAVMNQRFAARIATELDISIDVWSSSADGAEAGGDWCEILEISEEAIALTVGDVSGHGEAVAGPMAAMRASIVQAIREVRVPSEVLSRTNEAAYTYGNGLIVTAIVAFLNHRRGTLTFANAGHPPPLLLTGGGQAFLGHPPADVPIGIFPSYHAADYVIALPAEALLVLYTDGITEHDRDPIRGEMELVEAARRAFARPHLDPARAIARAILGKRPRIDDAAAIVARTMPAHV